MRYVCYVAMLMAAELGYASSPTITELHGFNGTDGSSPAAPLVQASDGNFYGTTRNGGDDGNGCLQGCDGTVFKITPEGQFTLLHTFVGGGTTPPYQNGRNPWGGLVEGPDGYLYGTTFSGGYPGNAYGIVYKISKTGEFEKLHDFCTTTPCADGGNPQGSLVLGSDGYFYGTTTAPVINPWIFRISSAGDYSAIASLFETGLGTPQNGLVEASDGDFYGVATRGVYRVTPKGELVALYFFDTQDGTGNAELIQAADGNLYSATYPGPGNSGSVFRISLDGKYQKILDLTASSTGTVPNALLQTSEGNLWDTTYASTGGGAGGTIYTVTTDGTLLQATFLTPSTGIRPLAPLIQATDRKLYGTASTSGSLGFGSIFVVDTGRPQFLYVANADSLGVYD